VQYTYFYHFTRLYGPGVMEFAAKIFPDQVKYTSITLFTCFFMDIHLKALGCRLNEAELEQWAQEFRSLGHRITQDSDAANLIVLNTCAVTSDAARKSRNLIHRFHRHNPEAKLVVSGCHASLDPEAVAQTLGVDLVVTNQDKDLLVPQVVQRLDLNSMPVMASEPGEASLFSRGRHRAFIKIQDGCRYRCTFCIVTEARGDERSRSSADIIDEINRQSEQGIKEIILTGVHVGGYGSDNDSSLQELVRTLLTETDIPRIRFASVEPWDLTTDIIVGFPGETEDDWRQTMDYVQETGFGHLHIFSYSPRAGTRAAGLDNQIPDAIKKQRSQELHVLGEELKKQHLLKQTDTVSEVLWERGQPLEDGMTAFEGYTQNFSRVRTLVDSTLELENLITPARITSLQGNTLLVEALI
jgi:threonylcarbamoyladenosine tRNA methylthiotransferase MtaB